MDFTAEFAQQVRVLRSRFSQELFVISEKIGLSNILQLRAEDWKHVPVLHLYLLAYQRFPSMRKGMNQEALFLSFSDTFSQVIAYALLTVRWSNRQQTTRLMRRDLKRLPQTTGVVRILLEHMSSLYFGTDIDACIEEICFILSNIDLEDVFVHSKEKPILHFYEDFLEVYQKGERKDKGVYYTPESVVRFMVRSTDDYLKEVFHIPLGLASTKTWKEVLFQLKEANLSEILIPEYAKDDDFFVRILDPATGTGTFIIKVVEMIRSNLKCYWTNLGWSKEQKCVEWNAYVRGTQGLSKDYTGQGLLDRLFAFELMEAPYCIAHIRLAILLYEDVDIPFVFHPEDDTNIFLVNALEHPMERDVVSRKFDQEHRLAEVQTKIPMTVVLGNPPYLGGASNRPDWITQQIEHYKYIHGIHFEERKHWLNDDYVRFFRLGQLYIERAGVGVLCYITPHSFLDNPTFRGMRKSLLDSFDDIFVVNLYGNARKVVYLSSGERDENIFDIMQGVSINLCLKTTLGTSEGLGKVQTHDVYGLRGAKLQFLQSHQMQDLSWKSISMNVYHKGFDYYFFNSKDFGEMEQYSKGFSLRDLFLLSTSGIVTARDSVVIDTDKEILEKRMEYFFDIRNSDDDIRKTLFSNRGSQKYAAGDTRGWKLSIQRQKKPENYRTLIQKIAYRPFDIRYLFYTPQMVDWGREDVMPNLIHDGNIGLVFKRGGIEAMAPPVFITNTLIDFRSWSRPGMQGGDSVGPLYVYDDGVAISNLNSQIVSMFQNIQEGCTGEDIIHYIYALTHSKKYMQTFSEFLSFDYPRIPYPTSRENFAQLVEKGQELRSIHLLEADICTKLPSLLRNKDGSIAHQSDLITQCRPKAPTLNKAKKQNKWNGQVWINKTQYFTDIPQYVWDMYIGGYQPARKWLKSRRRTASKPGMSLSTLEVRQYARVIVVLKETHRLMREIDIIIFSQC